MNGKWKIALSASGIIAAVILIFTMGMNYSVMQRHVNNDPEIHHTISQKEVLIDGRIRLHMAPLQVQINEMNKKLDLLLEKQ